MKKILLLMSILILNVLAAADEFDSVRCDSDIPKTLVGKRSVTDKVRAIEMKHANLALKNLGEYGMPEDAYSLDFWLICGKKFVFLMDHRTKKNLITDVIQIPDDLANLREALPGTACSNASNKVPDEFYAILAPDNSAKKVWQIDQATMKFVNIPATDFSCAKDR